MTRRISLAALHCLAIIALALIAAACGGPGDGASGGDGASVVSSERGDGKLIYSDPGGLYELDLATGSGRYLITAEPNTFLLDPDVSPGGDAIAYTVQPPPVVEGGVYDAGSDIWIASRDGSGARPLIEHEQPNQLLRYPRWQDDEHILAVVPQIVTREGVTSVSYTLQRFNIATLARETLLEDVLTFAVAPDGSEIAYARLSPQTGESLGGLSLADGTDSTLVGADQQVAPFYSIRYSPDGSLVAFTAADQTLARAEIAVVSLRTDSRGAPPAALLTDGLPQDVWTVEAQGGRARRLADLKEDLPTLAWSGDGERIYVLGTAGLYRISVDTGTVDRIGEGVFHGQLTWAP